MPDEAPEIQEASLAAEEDSPHLNTRRWLLENQVATLGTTTARRGLEGFPYASVVPYALDAEGRAFILIADIATHTANLRNDPRASLFLRDPHVEGDPQKSWRVTLMGTWECIASDNPALPELHARYVERVPWADGYLKTHSFRYWRLSDLLTVRYIRGFGKITWIDGARCLRGPEHGELDRAGPGAIQHMNEDHAHSLLEMVRSRYGVEAERAEMTAVDGGGLLVRTTQPDGLYHFSFGAEIDAAGLRVAVIDVLNRARQHAAP